MFIRYKDNKIKRLCTDYVYAKKRIGMEMADDLDFCVGALEDADCVEQLIENRVRRCHPLKGNLAGKYAMDLVYPYRLIFEKDDEGSIHIVLIEEIVNYHD